MADRIGLERDELIGVIFMALLFIAVLGGRELGNIYGSFNEISRLSVILELDEEETADFLSDVLKGADPDLEVGVALTLPAVSNVEGVVTQLPDYTRRWLISVTVNPVVVYPPEVSVVEIDILVEGESLQRVSSDFGREKIHYLSYLEQSVPLILDDPEAFRDAVLEASEMYGGEVKLTLTGRAQLHVLFLNDWLPFSTTRYPLVKIPVVEYISSGWKDSEGWIMGRVEVGNRVSVEFEAWNPTRVHSIHENVTLSVFRDGSETPVHTQTKLASMAPDSASKYTFQFIPQEPGVYRYSLRAENSFEVDKSESEPLYVD